MARSGKVAQNGTADSQAMTPAMIAGQGTGAAVGKPSRVRAQKMHDAKKTDPGHLKDTPPDTAKVFGDRPKSPPALMASATLLRIARRAICHRAVRCHFVTTSIGTGRLVINIGHTLRPSLTPLKQFSPFSRSGAPFA
jgi:hypothetical protein